MLDLKRKLMAVAIVGMLCMGVFAQKQGGDQRPPKEQNKVVVTPKEPRPPQNNNTQRPKNGDKRGKP